jgi:tetratricopeptide (TPR) repeat protein
MAENQGGGRMARVWASEGIACGTSAGSRPLDDHLGAYQHRASSSRARRAERREGYLQGSGVLGLKTVGVVLAALVLLFVIAYLTKPAILIEPFAVPKELEARGYTSQAVTAKIVDQIELVIRKARLDIKAAKFATSASEILPEIELPEIHTQLKSLIPYLQEMLGRKPLKVSGELTQYERKLSLTVRVNGSPYDDAVATFETSMDVPEGVFDQGAKQILRIADPYTLAASRFGEGDYNDALALIYRTLDSRDELKRGRAFALWGVIAERQGDDTTAEARYRDATAADPGYVWSRINLVYLLIRKYRFDEAESELDQIIRLERPFYQFWGVPNKAVDAVVARAELLRSRRDFEAALAQLAAAEKLSSDNAEIHLVRGDLFLQVCNLDGARGEYAKAKEISQDLAHSRLDAYYQATGNYAEAETQYKAALGIDPGQPSTHAALGWVFALQGRFPEAMSEDSTASRINSNSPAVHDYRARALEQMDQFEQAETALEQGNQLDPRDESILADWAEDLVSLKEYEKAKQKYDEALRIAPSLPAALVGEGDLMYYQGDYRGAISGYEKAIRVCPSEPTALTGIGYSYRSLGEYEEAKRWFEKAKQSLPLLPDGFAGSGALNNSVGDYAAAFSDANESLARNPRATYANVVKGVALMGMRQYREAIKEFRQATQVHSRDPDPWEYWGNLLQQRGDYKGAAANYNRAMELDPRSSAVPNDWGDMLFLRGDYPGAEKEYRTALTAAPHDPEIQAKLATTLARMKRMPEAMALLEQAKATAPRLPYVNFKWGQVLEERGDLQGAKERYEAACHDYPKSEAGKLATGAIARLHSQRAEATGKRTHAD